MVNHFIYKITCVPTQKIYIGSTHNVSKRYAAHLGSLRRGQHPNNHLQRTFDQYGANAFVIETIEGVSPEARLSREKYWIDYFDACNDAIGYNISKEPTAPMMGLTHRPESLAKMSISHRGKSHSVESRAKISRANKGKPKSAEHVEKMRLAMLGRKASEQTRSLLRRIHSVVSDETRRKLSETSRGRKRTPLSLEKFFEKRAGYFTLTGPQGETFEIKGLARFCREHGLDQGSMSKVISGKRRSHKGWSVALSMATHRITKLAW